MVAARRKLSRAGQIRVVSPSRGLPVDMKQVAQSSNRPVCKEVQQQVTSIFVTSSRVPSLGSICSGYSEQSFGEAKGLPMQKTHSDLSRIAQHALVWRSSGHVQPDPSVPTQPAD